MKLDQQSVIWRRTIEIGIFVVAIVTEVIFKGIPVTSYAVGEVVGGALFSAIISFVIFRVSIKGLTENFNSNKPKFIFGISLTAIVFVILTFFAR